MWRTRLFAAILIASLVYLGGSLLVSPYGREGQRTLEAHLTRLRANVHELETLNRRLAARAELLQRSSDAVELAARGLGFYEEGEEVIRLQVPLQPQVQSPGTILRRPAAPPDRSLVVRVATLLAFLTVLLLAGILQRGAGRSGHEIRRASR